VSELLFQPAEGWPLLDTEGHKKALAWVEEKVQRGAATLRVDYCSRLERRDLERQEGRAPAP